MNRYLTRTEEVDEHLMKDRSNIPAFCRDFVCHTEERQYQIQGDIVKGTPMNVPRKRKPKASVIDSVSVGAASPTKKAKGPSPKLCERSYLGTPVGNASAGEINWCSERGTANDATTNDDCDEDLFLEGGGSNSITAYVRSTVYLTSPTVPIVQDRKKSGTVTGSASNMALRTPGTAKSNGDRSLLAHEHMITTTALTAAVSSVLGALLSAV